MGKRGPSKLPTKLKEMRGTVELSRIIPNEVEYSPVRGVPDPPDYFDEVACQVWRVNAAEVHRQGLLYVTDLPVLEIYCCAVSMVRYAKKMIDELLAAGKDITKWFKIWKESAEVVNRTGGKFGFSPADKTAIAIPAQTKPNSLLK